MITVERETVSVEHHVRHKEHNPREIATELGEQIFRADEPRHVDVPPEVMVLDRKDASSQRGIGYEVADRLRGSAATHHRELDA